MYNLMFIVEGTVSVTMSTNHNLKVARGSYNAIETFNSVKLKVSMFCESCNTAKVNP